MTEAHETTPVEPAVELTTEAAPSLGAQMSREDMMNVIIKMTQDLENSQKELDESKTNKSKEELELKALKDMLDAQKAEEAKKELEKAEILSKALIDEWGQTLDQTEFDEASRESVLSLARNFPKESQAMMRIAHCASKKHKSLNTQFSEYKEIMKRNQLQEKFEAVMSKKRPAPTQVAVAPIVAQEVVHAASTKRAKTNQSNVSRFLSAMSKYNTSGSARDHMDAVSKIGAGRRNMAPRSAPNRAPYY